MIVVCETCQRKYDDEFRLTSCPHDTFFANDGNNNFRHYPESFIEKLVTLDRSEALQESSFIAGAKAGYNLGLIEDYEGLNKMIAARGNYLRGLREEKAK